MEPGQFFIPLLHFPDHPLKGNVGLLHVCNHRRNQVRDIVEQGKLNALGINHNELDLVRR